MMRNALIALGLAVVLSTAADSCSSGGLQGASPGPSQNATVKTPTAPPTLAPTPLALSGTGSKVTPPFDLVSGNYRVTWTAQGHDNFIVTIHGAGSAEEGLVNEIPPAPASGEALFRSGGGSYFLDIKASTLTWSIIFAPL